MYRRLPSVLQLTYLYIRYVYIYLLRGDRNGQVVGSGVIVMSNIVNSD